MVPTESTDDERTAIEWRRTSPDGVAPPVVRRVPYLELKLEHPSLDPDGFGERFFPDAVPYETDGTPRVFYWRSGLSPSGAEPEAWELACATTHELLGFDSLPADGPPLVTEGADGTTLVVDGTIAGEATTSRVASYAPPELTVSDWSDAAVELTANGVGHAVPVGERRRIRLDEQRVEPGTGEPATVAPELVVRYPGRREIHHPAPGASHRLFPSFGLDLDEVPNPLPVPTAAGELDDDALAAALNVDLSRRPYPVRVLWQAFAHTAFATHADAPPTLTELDSGHVALWAGSDRAETE